MFPMVEKKSAALPVLSLSLLMCNAVWAKTTDPVKPVPNMPLQGATAALKQITPQKSAIRAPKELGDETKNLLAEIESFSGKNASLPPQEAANQWLVLADRFLTAKESGDLRRSFSLLTEALPAPDAWPAISQGIQNRYANAGEFKVRNLALRMLGQALAGEKAGLIQNDIALRAALAQIEPPKNARYRDVYNFRGLRRGMAAMTGSRSLPSDFEMTRDSLGTTTNIPDLVTLEGKAKATSRLRSILVKTPNMLEVWTGDETRALARKLAVELASQLKAPQWTLAQSPDATQLYEILEKRFGQPSPKKQDTDSFNFREARRVAQSNYLVGLIIRKRTQEAVNLALRMGKAAQGNYYYDVQQQHVPALNAFLRDLLSKNPDLALWDLYISTSYNSPEKETMLALLRKAASRKGLPAAQADTIRSYLTQAYLATGKINEGVVLLRQEMSKPPVKQSEDVPPSPFDRAAESAVKLLRIGRLMKRADWEAEGVRYFANYKPNSFDPEYFEEVRMTPPLRALVEHGYEALVEKRLIASLKTYGKDEGSSYRNDWGEGYTTEGSLDGEIEAHRRALCRVLQSPPTELASGFQAFALLLTVPSHKSAAGSSGLRAS